MSLILMYRFSRRLNLPTRWVGSIGLGPSRSISLPVFIVTTLHGRLNTYGSSVFPRPISVLRAKGSAIAHNKQKSFTVHIDPLMGAEGSLTRPRWMFLQANCTESGPGGASVLLAWSESPSSVGPRGEAGEAGLGQESGSSDHGPTLFEPTLLSLGCGFCSWRMVAGGEISQRVFVDVLL